MTNSSSWWANKLAANEPKRYGVTIPTQAPQPVQYPAAQPPQHQAPPQSYNPNLLDPSRPEGAEIPMGQAMRLWRGGEAHKKEGHLACPSCGSATGYTAYSGMSAGNARVGGHVPRPHCFECGYNGSFAQGLESSWA